MYKALILLLITETNVLLNLTHVGDFRQILRLNKQMLKENKALSQKVSQQSEALHQQSEALHLQSASLHRLVTQVSQQSEALHQQNEYLQGLVTQLSELKVAVKHLKAQTVSAASVVPPDNLGLPLTTLGALKHLESQLTEDSSVGDLLVSNLLTI